MGNNSCCELAKDERRMKGNIKMKSNRLRNMFWISVLLSLVTIVAPKEYYQNNQESVLQSVSFLSVNSSSSGVPLFVLKMSVQKYPMCYPNSSKEQIIKLSLAICKQLGYDTLQRYVFKKKYIYIYHDFFPADVTVMNNLPPGKGLLFNTNCSSYQLEQQFCHWRFDGKDICNNYLGVECAECNYEVEITGVKKREIPFPPYVSCFTNSRCQWNIINRHSKYKVIVLDFRKEYFQGSHSKTIHDEDDSGHIEVKWYNSNNKKWTALRTTIKTLDDTSQSPFEFFGRLYQIPLLRIYRKHDRSLQKGPTSWIKQQEYRQRMTFTLRKQKLKLKVFHTNHKMVLISKTGLLEGVRKPVQRQISGNNIQFPRFAKPAPYTLRPFAGVYNPFPYGCSILCNHPADYEAKDVVKRAKDSW
ncbi:hypothetical protein L9F63_012064, partial [Diploptera punctata]